MFSEYILPSICTIPYTMLLDFLRSTYVSVRRANSHSRRLDVLRTDDELHIERLTRQRRSRSIRAQTIELLKT